MNTAESIREYSFLKKDFGIFEIKQILDICKKLKLTQQTLSVVVYNFYNARYRLQVENDEIIFFSALIDLSCKMCEFMKPIEKIVSTIAASIDITLTVHEINEIYIKEVNNMELEILFNTKFDLEAPLVFDLLQEICIEKKIENDLMKLSWLFLCDLVTFLPSTMFFTEYEIVFASLLIAHLVQKSKHLQSNSSSTKINNTKNPNDTCFTNIKNDFMYRFNVKEKEFVSIEFLCDELLKYYEDIQ